MLAAGLWMKLRKRRRCAGSGSRPSGQEEASSSQPASQGAASSTGMSMADDDFDDVMDGAPSDEEFEPPQPRGPVRSRRPQLRVTQASTDSKPAQAAAESAGPKPRKIVLLRSVFEGRPPVVLFSYTQACCATQRPMDRSVPAEEDGPRMFYSHTDAIHQYNAVINILRHGGLFRVRAETNRWTVLWSLHPTPEQLRKFSPVMRANHFPGSFHLGRKDLIWRNIAKMQQRFGKEYQITPQGYILPKAFMAWDAARARQPDALWIWKPCSQSCGRGIMVLSSDMSKEQSRELSKKRGIVQRYVPNPLLIGGRKFDMRIYVVVLSYDPLKIYINDEGLVRFATEKYSDSVDTLQSRMMHLTNYSVNKSSPAFIQNQDGRGEEGEEEDAAVDEDGQPRASKWSLKDLKIHFEREGLDFSAMWEGIKDCVTKTLIAVEEPMQAEWCRTLGVEEGGWAARGPQGAAGAHRSSCFELYGFDVLVDRNLKPWLLEVNICPSLSSGSPLDKRIKTKLVADVVTLVGVHPPAALWKLSPDSVHWPTEGGTGKQPCLDENEAAAVCILSEEEMAKRAQKFAACKSPTEALSLFDEQDWELVLEAHEEEFRSGGLERCFPGPNAGQYKHYWAEETYCNMVLRTWHEAGGGEIFRSGSRKLLPPWVPRQVCFNKT
eukprot:TRINITY_DN63782_c0_g1_i1.p1 TRINITY_DN63782_c0_g1~~TRINITY_DN63782_c0_g1_i1.p1  ORF type:complete len:663 (-),score=155.24 TRINITY_DN63782_c0_g1_i1:50-2038(-)